MNVVHFQRWGVLSVAAMALIMAGILAGCGSSSPVSSADQYQQKVYLIGEIKDPSTSATTEISEVRGPADAVKQVFVNRVAYDGVSADAPIFMAADQVLSLSATMRKGLLDTYRNSYPIIVVRGDEVQINALLGILGLEQNYKLPENFTYVELFAVDRDAGGNFQWSMYPPGASKADSVADAYVDSSTGWLSRAGTFRAWMKKDGSRVTPELMAFKQKAMKSLAAEGADSISESELTQLASVWHKDKIFTDSVSGNTYQLSFNIYSCHSFSSEDGKSYDWFYVEQNAILNAGTGYKGIRATTCEEEYPLTGFCPGSGEEIAKYYAGSYTMSNSMMSQGGDKSDQSVILRNHSPETTNTKTTTKSSFSFNIGGDVGFKASLGTMQSGGDVSGALKTGVTISNDRTFDTYDCTVENKSMSSGYTDDAKWLYTFDRATQYAYMVIGCRLNSPVKLSIGTLEAYNKWIWRFSPDVRENKKSYKNNFKTTLDVELMTTISGFSLVWIPVTGPYHGITKASFSDFIPLDYPPLIVAPSTNVTFNNAGQVKYMDVHVSSNWSASSDQPWCQAVPTTGRGNNTQMSISIDPNTTGKERKATITVTTNDGKGRDTMEVTQSQFENIGG